MKWRSALFGAFVCSSLATVGCYAPDPGAAEEIGEAAAPQLEYFPLGWRNITLMLDQNPLARVLVTSNSNSGNFIAQTEYWYVNTAVLPALGTKNIVFSHIDGQGTPPSASGSQAFTQPRDVTWASFTTDPVSVGALYKQNNVYLRIGKNANGITRLTWYQTLPGGTPANITPSGTFKPVSGPVAVPSGHTGYYIDQLVQ